LISFWYWYLCLWFLSDDLTIAFGHFLITIPLPLIVFWLQYHLF
jgi:hypothetical protein